MARKPRKTSDPRSKTNVGSAPAESSPEVTLEAPAGAPSTRAIVAAVAGIMAAWLAAGSMGLLAHPLRHALVWLAMAVAVLAAWPQVGFVGPALPAESRARRGAAGKAGPTSLLVLAAALVTGLILTIPATGAYNVLGVAVVLAVLAWSSPWPGSRGHASADERTLLIAAFAIAVLGIFRVACTTIAVVWQAADWIGQALGAVASAVCGRPLWVGATFGGVDFLVLMFAFCGAWLASTAPPRRPRAIFALAAILLGHLGYLVLLAYSIDLANALPVHPWPEPAIYAPPPWFASDALRMLLPWNVPLVAGLIQAAIAACMLRWGRWNAEVGTPRADAKPQAALRFPLAAVSFSLAVLIPVATAFTPVRCDLAGRKIVAYDHGELNWNKPVHDKYGRDSAGMYGMLPTLVSCLGGTLARSADLANADLADADVLLVIHPLGPWPEDRKERVWDFVRGGGSLLVVAEPWVYEGNQTSSFNEFLEPTSMTVRFDTAIGKTGLWQHALHVLAHPATSLLGDDHGRLGLAECASIDARWPARPLVVGRWGWSDPGSDSVLTGQSQLDPGERLGDLVLAAEERIGSGTVLVVGDATAFKNEGLSNDYEFVGRLLGYLAGHSGGVWWAAGGGWRQTLGLLGCVALVALLAWRRDPATLAWSSLVLALAFGLCTLASADQSKVLPDGRVAAPNCLACIDASHLEAYRGYPWLDSGLRGSDLDDIPADDPRFGRLGRDTGIAGLEMNLMRNGYLPIRLGELSDEQLQRAGMLVSIAPSRAYSASQEKTIRTFVERGGIWVCMVGGDRSGPINQTLSAFGLSVPQTHLGAVAAGVEPLAAGHLPSVYAHADSYDARLVFDSAWPITCVAENSETLAGGIGKAPSAVSVALGKGTIVLIGDGFFAANRNLENDVGVLWEGVRENAAFWRWLIARYRDRQDWTPPNIPLPKGETDEEAPP